MQRLQLFNHVKACVCKMSIANVLGGEPRFVMCCGPESWVTHRIPECPAEARCVAMSLILWKAKTVGQTVTSFLPCSASQSP